MLEAVNQKSIEREIKGNLYYDEDYFVETKKAVYKVSIALDDTAESPREWDNLGIMACWHNRYTLGDIQPKEEFLEHIADLLSDCPTIELYNKEYGCLIEDDEKIMREFNKYFISLPLYLYDHSGITMSTGSFSCSFDSGQVGIIYVSKEDIRKEYSCKNVTKKIRDIVFSVLESEVETHDHYISGECYGYTVEHFVKSDNNELETEFSELEFTEDGDSCWGFLGSNSEKSGMLDYISNNIECTDNSLVEQFTLSL